MVDCGRSSPTLAQVCQARAFGPKKKKRSLLESCEKTHQLDGHAVASQSLEQHHRRHRQPYRYGCIRTIRIGSPNRGPCKHCRACLPCPCVYGNCKAVHTVKSWAFGLQLSSPLDTDRNRKPCLVCADNFENGDAGLRHGSTNGPQERSLMRLWTKGCTIRGLAVALFFAGFTGFFRALSSGLPPDFSHRWRGFFAELHASLSGSLKGNRKCGSRIYDVNGELIATIGAVDNPKRPSLHGPNMQPSDIPAFMWQAVVASEDRQFFEHRGVDPRGIARALLSLSSNGGGSTITQQLAKNVFLTSERKWVRKLLEMLLAIVLELRMSKWDILYMYLKKIYWGHGFYGIEAASSFYFGKHPSMLNLGECAMLAGIIPAPELLSPFHEPSRGKKGQARALRRMVEAGFLDTCSAESTLHEPLHLGIGDQDGKPGLCNVQFFVDEVLYELKRKFGFKRVLEGGLQVHTTLDLRMQEVAEKAIQDGVIGYDNERVALAEMEIHKIHEQIEGLNKAREVDFEKALSEVSRNDVLEQDTGTMLIEEVATSINKKYESRQNSLQCSLRDHLHELNVALKASLEAALVAIDQSNGAVRVLVGGRNYYESSLNRVTQVFRPPGTSFKPIVYLAALAEGIDPRDILSDQSLLQPFNVPVVKLCAKVGVEKVCRMAQLLGIESRLPHDVTMALGRFEISPLTLATVYSTIAAGGIFQKPHFITRVETKEGEVLDNLKSIGKAVVEESTIAEVRKLLQAVSHRGTSKEAQIGQPCGGQSGTSDGHRDVWFAGFTPDLTSVVWLGYDGTGPVGGLVPGTGASHAAPVWRQFMRSIYEGQPTQIADILSEGERRKRRGQRFRKTLKKRIKLHKQVTKRQLPIVESKACWKDVWDWETASNVSLEQERMVDWTAAHLERLAQIKNMRTAWQHKIRRWCSIGTR